MVVRSCNKHAIYEIYNFTAQPLPHSPRQCKHVQQGKTKSKIRIEISGKLKSVIDRMRLRKADYKVSSVPLIVNEHGRALLSDTLRSQFDRARKLAGDDKSQFQFRDLRAKAGTNKAESAGDIR